VIAGESGAPSEKSSPSIAKISRRAGNRPSAAARPTASATPNAWLEERKAAAESTASAPLAAELIDDDVCLSRAD
jgi:hypothetical protein